MAYDREKIWFSGDNSRLFERIEATDLNADARIIVPSTHNAILIKDGQMMDTLAAGSYPVFDVHDGKKVGSIQVEAVYLSRTAKMRALWGTQNRFTFRDAQTDIPYRVGARGEYEVSIADPRKAYLELIGSDRVYTVEHLHDRLLTRLLNRIEPAIARSMKEWDISYERLVEVRDRLSESLFPDIRDMLAKDYGLTVHSFTIEDLRLDEGDIRRIEEELSRRREKSRADLEREEQDEREFKRRAEENAERERREDREWEREKYRLELEAKQRERYLDVTREIGWEGRGNTAFCAGCGAPLQAGAKFCGNCGKPTAPAKPVCPKCGKESAPGMKFCAYCGAPLEA